MERPRQGLDRNFRGARMPSGQRPALLPRPNAPPVDSAMFSLPPPIRLNTYPQGSSEINQPTMPSFNTPPLSMNPNCRPNITTQLPGIDMNIILYLVQNNILLSNIPQKLKF